jgi:hypothetical protein
MDDNDSTVEIMNDFTLLEVEIKSDGEGQQHFVMNHGSFVPNRKTIESIPWSEIIGRRITGVSGVNGRLILGLSTKE